MTYTIYNSSTGEILSTVFGNGDSLATTLNNQPYIEGAFNSQQHYVDIYTKAIVNKPQQPSENYNWDWTTKSWILDNTRVTNSARAQRNNLLSIIDRVNPIWFSSLTSDEQQELSAYRQALLNVPQQSGFPITIEWPTKPSWL
jgi:hypothetical protein